MKILLACPYDWHAPGGVQIHVRQLASALRERGHRTLVVAPGSVDACVEETEPPVRIVGRPVRVPYNGTVAPISFSPGSWRRIRSA
ncbi:MAG: glycosyltransferase, partial [Actinomycetota bacterium]